MIAEIASGERDAADIFFLVAAVIFAVEFVLLAVGRNTITRGVLPAAGLCLVAVAWLLLLKQKWSWAGASVLVLAVCLGSGWATAIIMSASSRTPPITDSTKDLLSSVGGVLAGAVTAYIGGQIAHRRHHDRPLQGPQSDETGSEDV